MNRKFDDMGRISLPKEMRNKIGLNNGDEAKIELVGTDIIISNPSKVDLYEEWLNTKLKELDKMFDETDDESKKEFILHNVNAYKIALNEYRKLRG